MTNLRDAALSFSTSACPVLLIFPKTFIVLGLGLIRVQTLDRSVAIKASFLCTFRAEKDRPGRHFHVSSLVNSISPFLCLRILSVGTVRARTKERERKRKREKVSLKSYQRQTAVDKTFIETPGSPRDIESPNIKSDT